MKAGLERRLRAEELMLSNLVLEKTLESPLDSKEIIPVNPKRNQPEYSLERLMLKLKLQCFGHQMERITSLEKTLKLGKIEGRRRMGRQMMRWLDGITDSMDVNLRSEQIRGYSEGQGGLACCSP